MLVAGASTSAAAAPESMDAIPAAESPGTISATFLDPYSVFGASDSRLDAMFSAQHDAGIDTVIVQWTGSVTDSGTTVTTYPASSSTGFGAWDAVLPRLLASAARNHVKVWLGLVLKSSLLDLESTRADTALLDRIARDDGTIAADLLTRYGGQFEGWYIPTEPGYETIADPSLLALHGAYLADITGRLDALPTKLPVMISPSVPRAIEGNLSGVEFVNRLEPLIRDSGIDVWNLQDGYKMTAWTPAQNVALIQRGQELGARYGARIWTTIYTPGPDAAGNMSLTPEQFFADLDAVSATGAPVTVWTFDEAFNPDPSRTRATARASLYTLYMNRRP